MALAIGRGQCGDHRQRGRDGGDAQPTGKTVPERIDLLTHGARVADDAARPVEHALAFRGKALEARAAVDQEHAHLLLELFDAGRKRRLCHAAGLGGAAEVLLTGQGQDEVEFVDHPIKPYFIRYLRN